MVKQSFIKARVVAFAVLVFVSMLNAQDNKDVLLLTVGDTKITLAEFENIYRKNSKQNVVEEPSKPVSEYVDLFVNFKLKVKEAEVLGLDTVQKFIEELGGYRRQLIQPYLTDREVNDKLLAETYQRLKEEICVSHILIKCAETASPKDTLEKYNKAMKLYARIQKGESFEKLAAQKSISDDTMLLDKAGYIGCFTALELVYPFETVAYNTQVGEVSTPIRTRYGYHIIKVNNRRKASGEILVAHIMLKNKPNMSATDSVNQNKKITELYNKLKAGESFDKLASDYSEDRQTAVNGGKLPWITINRTPPEFEKEAFALQNKEDITSPVRTPYGVHIIKLIDRKELGQFDEVKAELKQKMIKASRFNAGRDALVERLKQEYNYSYEKAAMNQIYPLLDTTFFHGKWVNKKTLTKNRTLFVIDNKAYTQDDFIQYRALNQHKRPKTDLKQLVDLLFKQYVDEVVIAYEESRLEQKYPEFKALMREYRDGILLFELTDKKVWSKAVKDSAGLRQYYESNKAKYTWGPRAYASLYTCADKKCAKKVRKMIKKNKTEQEIMQQLNKKSQLNLQVETKNYLKDENKYVMQYWKEGVSDDIEFPKESKTVLVHIKKIDENAFKFFEETKGIVISDYQNHLEQEWVADLRSKYEVVINQDILSLIK